MGLVSQHYQQIKDLYHHIPVPLLLGQPNTGKTLLSKVVAAVLGGLHKRCIYHDLTMAKMAELLSQCMFLSSMIHRVLMY